MAKKHSQLDAYFPVLVFIVTFFLFELTEWMQATKFSAALFLSQLSFMVMANLLKDKRDIKKADIRRVNFLSGLLSIFLLAIFGITYLHWNAILPYFWRMAVLVFALVIYFAVMFRGLRVLEDIRKTAPLKKE